VNKSRPRDGEYVAIQPRQLIRKPEPRRSWDNTARRQAARCVQVDPMHGRGLLALALEQVKVLARIHGQVDVKLAYLATQPLDGIRGQEGIDLIEDGACLILQHEAVLQNVSIQGRSWRRRQPRDLL